MISGVTLVRDGSANELQGSRFAGWTCRSRPRSLAIPWLLRVTSANASRYWPYSASNGIMAHLEYRTTTDLPRLHDMKPTPNRQRYIEILRAMTPEQRLAKAFELSRFVRELFREGLKKRYPEMDEADLHELYLARLAKAQARVD
jgi:hypothetical protein